MLKEYLKTIYSRDIKNLKLEIESYGDEKNIWLKGQAMFPIPPEICCLHLIGNLNTYLGAVIGKTGYIRDRDLEF